MLRKRLPPIWIALIAIMFLFSGCGQQTTPTSSLDLQPQQEINPTFTISTTDTYTSTPLPSPSLSPTSSPTMTSTPPPPEPGEWIVQAENLGEFQIDYYPEESSVALTSVEFMNFQCEDLGIDGKWLPDSHTGEVINGQFRISGRITGYMELAMNFPPGTIGVINFPDVTIEGLVNDAWELLNGTWEVTWDDLSCTGAWQSSGEAIVIPTESKGLPEPYYIYPFCQCREEIPTDQAPILRWGWIATSQAYTEDFITASHTTLIIDDIPYQGLDHLWSKVEYSEEDQGYKSLWIYPLPALPQGLHRIEFVVSLNQAITDGYDSDGDGQLDQFGPGELSIGWVEMNLTKASEQPYAACPNNAPAGYWELIIEKRSPGESEITIDGQPLLIRSGKNVIYLLIDKSHTIKAAGTTILGAPECEWNTLVIP